MYHALGYSTISYLQAMMTFEPVCTNDLQIVKYRMIFKNRVCTGPAKAGKSWNFTVAFSMTGKSWKRATGPGKCWKSVKLK